MTLIGRRDLRALDLHVFNFHTEKPPMQVTHARQEDIWPRRHEFHVLTYAEEGFAPLNIHAEPAGVTKEQLVAFAVQVNRRFETGSLHPPAPISAVPRALIRDMKDSDALRDHIADFLRANIRTMRATKLICDFRTPRVQTFVVAAINAAIGGFGGYGLDEVLILE